MTKLLGPTKWTYFYLYVILDIFSRYVVGWMLADRENSALAGRLIEETCHKQGVEPQVLTLHSDRGAPMTSKCTAQLLADLGVVRSLSRPRCPTTIHSPRRSSRRSSTTLASPAAFPGSTRPSRSAARSSRGTTPSIATAASPCSPPTMSTTVEPQRCWNSASAPSKPPAPLILNDSFGGSRNPAHFPKPSGSTHPILEALLSNS